MTRAVRVLICSLGANGVPASHPFRGANEPDAVEVGDARRSGDLRNLHGFPTGGGGYERWEGSTMAPARSKRRRSSRPRGPDAWKSHGRRTSNPRGALRSPRLPPGFRRSAPLAIRRCDGLRRGRSGCVAISGGGSAIARGGLAVGARGVIEVGLGVVGEPIADGRLHVSLRGGDIAVVLLSSRCSAIGRESTAVMA